MAASPARALAVKRVGMLIPLSERDEEAQRELRVFRDRLGQLGWIEGKNLQFDYRWSGGDFTRIRPMVSELVARKPDLIVSRTTPVTAAVVKETRTIPIVFVVVSDPVGDGFVTSMARPGMNVTGFTNVEASLGGKWIQLLKELRPGLSRVGALFNPKTAPGAGGAFYMRSIEEAGAPIGARIVALPAADGPAIERAIESLAGQPDAALLVMPDVTNLHYRKLIVDTVARYRILAVYPTSAYAADGALATYGVDLTDLYRRSAEYVDRILRGAKPGELPVQAPVKFELIFNLKTAKALGISIPDLLLVRADRVIQ
jgi:putative ABC transport system substrate-binding protein